MPKGKSLRRRLIREGALTCYYCGLPFWDFTLPKGSPGARKARGCSRPTLEHLEAVSRGGETREDNCVVAHFWCNSEASTLSIEEKAQLKAKLSQNGGVPPWWHLIEKAVRKVSR